VGGAKERVRHDVGEQKVQLHVLLIGGVLRPAEGAVDEVLPRGAVMRIGRGPIVLAVGSILQLEHEMMVTELAPAPCFLHSPSSRQGVQLRYATTHS
jgi:hypothetical protein